MNATVAPSPAERLLTAKQAADRLGVSDRWVRDHATRRSPKIPVVKLGPLLRFRSADLDAFVLEQRDDHSGTNRRKPDFSTPMAVPDRRNR